MQPFRLRNWGVYISHVNGAIGCAIINGALIVFINRDEYPSTFKRWCNFKLRHIYFIPEKTSTILLIDKKYIMDSNIVSNHIMSYKEKKSSGITFLLNFFTVTGAGFFYLGDKYTNRGVVYVVITFFLAFISIITGGIGFIFLIPWYIFVIVSGFSATEECNRTIDSYNSKIQEQIQINQNRSQRLFDESERQSQKVKCSEFVESLEKYNKLFKNDIISQEEFTNKKQKLINNVVLYKVVENPEDFLSVIIDLKTKEILTQEDLQKIKKAIL